MELITRKRIRKEVILLYSFLLFKDSQFQFYYYYKKLIFAIANSKVKSSFPTYDLENFLNKNERSIQKTCDTVQTVNNGSIKLNKCEKMDRQASELFEEINELKLDNQHQADIIAALKCQVSLTIFIT